jgi:hypothetical protein
VESSATTVLPQRLEHHHRWDHALQTGSGASHPVSLAGRAHPNPLDTTDPNPRLTTGTGSWRAGCSETGLSGSEGGPRKRIEGNLDTAPRSDPYTHFAGCDGIGATAVMDLVTRKWLATIVSTEETSTQVQVVFTDALEAEGL